MKPIFKIAVRALVEHTLRCGDLRFDFLRPAQAVEGIRAHQRIQKSRPDSYQAEMPVSYTLDSEHCELCISGRIDGVFEHKGHTVVEEIKTTNRSLDEMIERPNALHWGQAKCYAYIWAYQEQLKEIDVQLTYVQLNSAETREIVQPYNQDELSEYFTDLLQRYQKWMQNWSRWTGIRDQSIHSLEFPFMPYRPGQRDMAVAVYRTLRDGGQLLVQAATGIGKTMAVLFSAMKALADQAAPKVVFLTARTTGRVTAESTLNIMRNKGLRLKSVTLTAKEKICFNPDSACLPEECVFAQGYYDRLNDALTAAFAKDAMERSVIEAIAKDYQICPFEFSLELINWVDCVIGDYNYAFDPNVKLRRLFDEYGPKHAVLVDEAHNLVDRSREMFSAELNKKPFLALRRKLKIELPGVYQVLGRVNSWLATQRRSCNEAGGEQVEDSLPEELIQRLRSFLHIAEKWLLLNIHTAFREDLLTLFFNSLRFVRTAEQFDHRYAIIYQTQDDDLRIKLFCIDPSDQIQLAWQRCKAAVLFSATMTPASYFRKILGCHLETPALNLVSPFPNENLAVFAAVNISTLYQQRKATSQAVTNAITNMVAQRKGHYLIFFPSYAYLSMIHERFIQDNKTVRTIVQKPNMKEMQREDFLHQFNRSVQDTLVGFAVMGGIFGEGIDLKGECLTAAAIIGVGLPSICPERELIRKYYDQEIGKGFEFAYQFPGINRVLQAAGRVIRSETDKGMILLIDQRYAWRLYRTLLPQQWHIQQIDSRQAFIRQLQYFWEDSECPN